MSVLSLDALAPDQRAVVQLVLQQDRAYEDLAVLLGISAEAVRERAYRGLERLAPGEAVHPDDRADVADYLLGQQSVSEREATRSLLAESQPARSWAEAVAAQLSGIARSGLPEIPAGAAPPRSRPEPAAPATAEEPVFLTEEPTVDEVPPRLVEPAALAEPQPAPAPTRARPRPRAGAAGAATPSAAQTPPDFGFDTELEPEPPRDPDDPRSNRLGGALLIGAMALAVATLIIVLVSRGGDSNDTQTATNSTTTPSASAAPAATGTPGPNDFQPIGTLPLTAADGGNAKGQVVVFANQAGQVAFNLTATGVPPNPEGQAYGVWLTGGNKPRFLGFPAQQVGQDGKLAVSGPRQEDAAKLTAWLQSAKRLVVSRETKAGASAPGPLLLIGDLQAQAASADGGGAPGGAAPAPGGSGTAPGGAAPAPGGSGTAPAPTP